MLNPVRHAKYKRDLERMRKRGKKLSKLTDAMDMLLDGTPLPPQYKDHPLKGDLAGYRGCHLEFDWVLIYAVQGKDLILFRTGTHADILE